MNENSPPILRRAVLRRTPSRRGCGVRVFFRRKNLGARANSLRPRRFDHLGAPGSLLPGGQRRHDRLPGVLRISRRAHRRLGPQRPGQSGYFQGVKGKIGPVRSAGRSFFYYTSPPGAANRLRSTIPALHRGRKLRFHGLFHGVGRPDFPHHRRASTGVENSVEDVDNSPYSFLHPCVMETIFPPAGHAVMRFFRGRRGGGRYRFRR